MINWNDAPEGALELLVELSGDEFMCDGCDTVKSTDHLGGYRMLCDCCVDAVPNMPKAPIGTVFLLDGKYPEFKWVIASTGVIHSFANFS